MKETAINKGSQIQRQIRTIGATIRLLYQVDAKAFLISTSTGVMKALFFPLFLLLAWKGFSLVMAGEGQSQDLFFQGMVLVVGFFGLLAIHSLLEIVNETATSFLKAVSSQQASERLMSKMSEIPYQFFEENDFQARYGLLTSQAAYRPSQLVDTLIHSLSSLVSILGIAVTLLAFAPLLVVLLLVLIPLTAAETRFHRRTLELQSISAPDLFRMQYLSQKSLVLAQGKAFSLSWGMLVECLGYIEQVFDFLNQSFEPPVQNPSLQVEATVTLAQRLPSQRFPTREMSIHLQDVSYTYSHTDKIALSQVTHTFSTGTTAIVGPNGAGKSTLVKLLTGLLAPTSGQISAHLQGGVYLPPQQLHKAVLFQEPSHLYLTIRQNITMSFDKMPNEDERIFDVLAKAGLSKVVKGLPDGIDTLVGAGFGGKTDLSGGQWQRLALARLIYQDAPVIILDEPVASLDPQGERAVFELFSQQAQSKIILFTTHRYDSIPRNTKIVVLVDGIISESGTHEELLQKQSDYWSLYMTESLDRAVPALANQPDHAIHMMDGQTRSSI